ncbi:hypothetical protein GCM10009551_070360 [Nocardiopsis tropica]
MRTRWWIFLGSVLLCGAPLTWAAVSGPDPFPTHFSFRGDATSWAPKSEALTTLGLLAGGLAILFGGLAAFAPKLPDSAINTPRRGYWLTPQHRPEFDATMSRFFLAIGALTQLMFAGIFLCATAQPSGGTVALVPAIGLLAILGVVVYLVQHLLTAPARSSSPS